MSQRESGYERKERDLYETPAWVTEALLPHLPKGLRVWECAAGSGKMAKVLSRAHHVVTSDIAEGADFLTYKRAVVDAIITNPPYALARQFIDHALKLMSPRGLVAMLLRCDFDHAQSRQHLFGQGAQFAKKLVLTRPIIWFEGPKAAPSFNHAWFIWDWKHSGPPVLAFGPQVAVEPRPVE